MSRRQVAPGRWLLEDPATPHRSPGSYASVGVSTGPDMRPVVKHAQNLENRHRVKPPNPLSIRRENRL